MAMLTVAGIDLEIQHGATESDPFVVGEASRSFDGTFRSSRRATKRAWRMTTGPITQAAYEALRTAVQATGGIVSCGGEALNNQTVDCLVTVGQGDFIPTGGTGFVRTLQLTLEEA